MTDIRKLEQFTLPQTIDGVDVSISGMYRPGTRPAVVFLHGFGGSKEDYADVIQQSRLNDHAILAYDAPGCGASTVSDPTRVSIPFLVSTAEQVLAAKDIERLHISGHSMGGLTSLMFADANPGRVLSFTNIEGNIALEDCFLSRQIISHSHPDPQAFFADFQSRVWTSRYYSSAIYAAGLPQKVTAEVVRPIFESMVELSANGGLTDRFLGLGIPRMLVYGQQNNSLSYLETLRTEGVELAEITRSGHFPMYSNPVEMWERIVTFIGTSPQD